MIICDFNIKHNEKTFEHLQLLWSKPQTKECVTTHLWNEPSFLMSGHINEIVSSTCTFQVVQYILL